MSELIFSALRVYVDACVQLGSGAYAVVYECVHKVRVKTAYART